MKKKIFLITLITILVDQIIKYIICFNNVNVVLIPNFLSLIYTENTGVAFGMLSNQRILIIGLSIALIFWLCLMVNKEIKEKKIQKVQIVAYGILFGGIIGNLVDRIVRGVVIDYVSLKLFGYHFPIFNLADLAITIGVILITFMFLKDDNK